jgi:hypothetical protein
MSRKKGLNICSDQSMAIARGGGSLVNFGRYAGL